MADSDKNRVVRKLINLLRNVMAPYLAMSKKKWSSGIDIRMLSGEEWLRFLTGETNMAAFVGWCVSCRVGECYQDTCTRCGGALSIFDEPFWLMIGSKIRRTLQKHRSLLARIKSDRENLYGAKYKPVFPHSLEWLFTEWEQTMAPPHQPFAPHVHYQVANWIASLRRLGLSKLEIIEVLGDSDLPVGLNTGKRQDYANLPYADLLTLRKEFRRVFENLPGSVTDLSEMGRTLRWVGRQRTFPMARLRGERVRERNASEN